MLHSAESHSCAGDTAGQSWGQLLPSVFLHTFEKHKQKCNSASLYLQTVGNAVFHLGAGVGLEREGRGGIEG